MYWLAESSCEHLQACLNLGGQELLTALMGIVY